MCECNDNDPQRWCRRLYRLIADVLTLAVALLLAGGLWRGLCWLFAL